MISEFAPVINIKRKLTDMLKTRQSAALEQHRRKLAAWWSGYDFMPLSRPPVVKPAPQVRHAEAPHHHGPSISARARVSEELWGTGCVTPGPAEFIREVTAWLGLTSEMSMLDIGAGLGGPARAIAETYGIWITAYEAEQELAKFGMELSTQHGMARKVPVNLFDPESIELPKRKYDAVFCKELLYSVENKTRLLHQISDSLKEHGQFFITDYVVAEAAEGSPRIFAWNEAEGRPGYFWTRPHYGAGLNEAKFELRVSEDLTGRYLEFITEGFRELSKKMNALIGAEADPAMQSELRRALAFESQRWAARTEAMQAKDVAVIRFSGNVVVKTKIR